MNNLSSNKQMTVTELIYIVAGSSTDGGIIGTRLFTSPGGQWRSPSALPFQSTETVRKHSLLEDKAENLASLYR